MATVYADIEFLYEPDPCNSKSQGKPYITATCQESGEVTDPVYGHGVRSVKRALATLSEECSCGSKFHKASNEEDEEDE
jgi:hypothetical protein